MLACHVRTCNKDNFPLQFADVSLEVRPTPSESINLDFIARFIPKLAYPELVATARSLGYGRDKLPDEMPETLLPGASRPQQQQQRQQGDAQMDEDDDDDDSKYSAQEKEFLQQLWHVLMEVSKQRGRFSPAFAAMQRDSALSLTQFSGDATMTGSCRIRSHDLQRMWSSV